MATGENDGTDVAAMVEMGDVDQIAGFDNI